MTIRFSYSAAIDRPIEQVYAVITDIAGMGRWSNVRSVRNLPPGPLSAGSTFQLVAHMGGEDRTADCTVTVLEPPRRFVYVSTGVAKSEIAFELQAASAQTKLLYRVAITVNALVEPLIKGEVDRQARLDLQRLVRVLMSS